MNVLDVNDNTPVFAEDVIRITVNEGEDLRQTLLTLTATDADSDRNGQISYSVETIFGEDSEYKYFES